MLISEVMNFQTLTNVFQQHNCVKINEAMFAFTKVNTVIVSQVYSTVPEQTHEPELLGHSVVNLVVWVPVIHLLPLGRRRLLE